MTRYFLAFFFFLMYAGNDLGLTISLGPGMSLKNVVLYSIFLGIAINTAVAKNRKPELLSVLVPFGLIIVYSLITWIAASFVFEVGGYDIKASFVKLKSSLGDEFLTFVVFFYGVRYARDAQWLIRVIIWIAIVGNIVTLIDAFDVPNLNLVEARPRDGRFLGFIGSANGYGAFLVLFLPATVALYMRETGSVRKLAAVGIIATAFALVLTLSRGAYVGLIGVSMLAAIYLREHIRTQVFWRYGFLAIGICAVLVVVSIILGYSDQFMERMGRFEGSAHLATSGRSTIWSNALKAMIENPHSFITGFGYNAYESSTRFYAATHNHYLNYLYNLGIIGLSLFVTVFVRMLSIVRSTLEYAALSVRPYFIAVIFGVLGLLITQMFSEYHASGVLLMAYLGASMRLAVATRKAAQKESTDTLMPLGPGESASSSDRRGRTMLDRTMAANRNS